jgi:hypothetical protein
VRITKVLFAAGVAGGALVVGATPAAAAPNTKAFCTLNFRISETFNNVFGNVQGTPTAQDIQRADTKITPLAEDALKVAPAAVAGDVKTAVDLFHSNFGAAIQDPKLQESGDAIDNWAFTHCGYNTAKVSAREYSFHGLPSSFPTGIAAIKLTNNGSQVHEISVARIKTNDSVSDLLKMPEDQVNKKVAFIGGSGPVDPGTSSVTYLKLAKKGRYAALCFIPDGTTSQTTPGTGPPHAQLGMEMQFRVT